MQFPVSGIETPWWLPPAVAAVISFFTSMTGVSGACLLLPFQVSVLGFTSPAVSATNLVFNIVAIPGGLSRYWREGRLLWPLAWTVVAGTFPGVALGALLRLAWLPDPVSFKVFAGCVLLYIGGRLLWDLVRDHPFRVHGNANWETHTVAFGWRRLAFEFQGSLYQCSTPRLFLLALVVGIIGGAYGIGGGAIMAPFLVSVFGLPVHAVAGATLMSTFATSVFGVSFYHSLRVAPDWPLGLLFGLGGLAGTYLGARAQRFVSAAWLKALLGLLLVVVALVYISGWLSR